MSTNPKAAPSNHPHPKKKIPACRILGKGKIAVQIVEAAEKALQSEEAKTIARYWRVELSRLRVACGVANHSPGLQDRLLSNAITQYVQGTGEAAGIVSLFRVALGRKARIEMPVGIEELANHELQRQFPIYEKILGPFMEKDFFQQAADQIEQNNFSGSSTAFGNWRHFLGHLNNPQSPNGMGIQTGLTSFDKLTGGLVGVNLLAGPTYGGKTSLAVQLADGVIEKNPDTCVLFVELEDPQNDIYTKLLSRESGLPFRRLRDVKSLTELELEKMTAGQKKLEESVIPRFLVIDRMQSPSSGGTLETRSPFEDLKTWVKLLKAETGCKRCVVVVDSLRRIVPITMRDDADGVRNSVSNHAASDEDRLRELIDFQKSSQTAAFPNGDPILVICRCRKDIGSDIPLTIDDVHGSTFLTYDARAVVLLQWWGKATSSAITPVRLAVDKVKDGGERGEIFLDFHHRITRMFERPKPTGATSSKPQNNSSQATAKTGRLEEKRG